ncbi:MULTISPECIES: ankyrin repeat domain-containing protein [unclassified Paenibacillus]|uniref:ankyrin repeat domain-containing protein n=1 Tax=unclassified Paenibacillus TaxID=185978 RepID=UPI00277D1F05|nr:MULTISPECIES: ankyrin repeat domain-containing protein [unclassified Paenibacillus]MDQ0896302.1 hypothetical protein [Paenibacillus sp. V4I7]MDQ0913770.1 hypothetical protein [Paenibacillus sp. V4I5]
MDSNFVFLQEKWPVLATLGAQAEKNIYQDTHTTQMKVRVFAELLTKYIFAKERIRDTHQDQISRINTLSKEGVIPTEVVNILHRLRMDSNPAHHEFTDSFELSQSLLIQAYELAVWFFRVYGDSSLKILSYQLPLKQNSEIDLKDQLSWLSKQYEQQFKNVESELIRLQKEYLSAEEIRSRRDQSLLAANNVLSHDQIHELFDKKLLAAQQEQKTLVGNKDKLNRSIRIYKLISLGSFVCFLILLSIFFTEKQSKLTMNQTSAPVANDSHVNLNEQSNTAQQKIEASVMPSANTSNLPMTDTKSENSQPTVKVEESSKIPSSLSSTPVKEQVTGVNKPENVQPPNKQIAPVGTQVSENPVKPSSSVNSQPVVSQATREPVRENLEEQLAQAIKKNATDQVITLLKKGADPNNGKYISGIGYSDYKPLMSAVILGNLKMVQALLDACADVNYKRSDNLNSLNIITRSQMKGQSKELAGIVSILLNKGIDPNIVFEAGDKRSLIIDAASSNNFEIVKLLVQYKANVNSYDIHGKTALYSNLNLYSEGNVEIAKFLLDNEADPYIQSTYGNAAEIIKSQTMYKDLRVYLKEKDR